MPDKSSQEVGVENASKLRDWVEQTPLSDVPRNYYGRSSKLAICRVLEILPSTIRTNKAIKEIFEELDSTLTQLPTQRIKLTSENIPLATSLPLAELLAENDALRAELARLRHLSNSGQWVSKE